MIPSTDDTICAIASAAGGAVRGIVRVAGPQSIEVAAQSFIADDSRQALDTLQCAIAVDGTLRLAAFSVPVPCTLYVWPGPQSYTRSAMVEIHTIGSPPILESILTTMCSAGARLAQPGEFTMRAFLAGRMDLTQAEAVLGVIDAQSEKQLDVALRQLAGGLAGPLADVRQSLIALLAELEAGLDFVEEDIEFVTPEQVCTALSEASERVASVAHQLAGRTDERQSTRVTLIGNANVGKSTLFNAILQATNATDHGAPSIVNSEPGTTRDYRTATVTQSGAAWQLVDTAGVESVDALDRPRSLAQVATEQQRRDADIRILCIDASRALDEWESRQLARAAENDVLVVATKCDLANADTAPTFDEDIATSAAAGEGVAQLVSRIAHTVLVSQASATDAVASTAARCRESLSHVHDCLGRAEALAAENGGHELIAAELRTALDQLGQVVGAVYTDDILDRIFSQFCIGK